MTGRHDAGAGWLRGSLRGVAANSTWVIGLFAVAVGVLVYRDVPAWITLLVLCGLPPMIAYEILTWAKTRYRITADRFEIRKGLIFRTHRSVQRDRIRSVDLTAEPISRLFRVVAVKIGTGQAVDWQNGDTLRLDGLDRAVGDDLRALLRRGAGQADVETVAAVRRSWARYAPLSIWPVVIAGGAVGAARNVLEAIGVPVDQVLFPAFFGWLGTMPLAVAIGGVALGLFVIGQIGALGLFAETWWRFRLTREPDGTLRVGRGLLISRSTSLEENRLRGAEVTEPLLLRLGGGAYTRAIATGMRVAADKKNTVQDSSVLLPPAPRAEAHRVAAAVLREDRAPTAAELSPHPRQALWRRVRWAVLAVAAVVGTLWVLGVLLTPVLLTVAWIAAVVLPPIGLLLALDAYRNLGHSLVGRYVVTRYGTIVRRTIALLHEGVIGWNVRQWVFHRRSGLCTLTATTSGGDGSYRVVDVLMPEGLAFALESGSDVLAQFLVGESPAAGSAGGRMSARQAADDGLALQV